MMTKHEKRAVVERLVRLVGPDATKADLARRLDVRPQDIQNWCLRGIPATRVDSIEREFDGAISKHEMRPDCFSAADETAAA